MANCPRGGDCSLLSVVLQVLCPGGPGSGRILWAPGVVAREPVSLPQSSPLPGEGEVVDLRLSLGSFSFTFPLAGVGTPWLESARGDQGKPQLISPLVPRLLTLAAALHPAARTRWRYRMGGGSTGGGGSAMEFFPRKPTLGAPPSSGSAQAPFSPPAAGLAAPPS